MLSAPRPGRVAAFLAGPQEAATSPDPQSLRALRGFRVYRACRVYRVIRFIGFRVCCFRALGLQGFEDLGQPPEKLLRAIAPKYSPLSVGLQTQKPELFHSDPFGLCGVRLLYEGLGFRVEPSRAESE